MQGNKPFAREIFVDVIRGYFFTGRGSIAAEFRKSFLLVPDTDRKMIPNAMVAMVATGVSSCTLSKLLLIAV